MIFLRIFGDRENSPDPDKADVTADCAEPAAGSPPSAEPATASEEVRAPHTSFDLQSLYESKSTPLAFADAFSPLGEPERKKLSNAAQKIFSEARQAERNNFGIPSYEGGLARLALLACCPWSQAKRVVPGRLGMFPHEGPWLEAVKKILIDRRPGWADDWVILQLESTSRWWWHRPSLTDVRELIKAGVIRKPTSDAYIRLLAQGSQEFDGVRDADVIATDIWRFFTVDTMVFDWVPQLKKGDPTRSQQTPLQSMPGHPVFVSWVERLNNWARGGIIDRGRLIDAALAAFWQDFRKPARHGLVHFVEMLELTDDEIAAREGVHRDLLRSDNRLVVGMTLTALKRLAVSQRLDAAAFLESIPACFAVTDKTRAKSALLLIERVLKSDPQQRPAALRAVTAALSHESTEVHDQAVKLLEKWQARDQSLDVSEVAQSTSQLGAQHRRRLEELAGQNNDAQASTAGGSKAATLDQRHQAALNRLAALPAWVRGAAGLGALDSALEKNELPPAFDPDPTVCPVLSGVEPIEPINTLDELIDAVAHLFEVVERPEQIERIVDAIMRLGRQRSDDFEAKTQGLCHAINHRPANRLTGAVELLCLGRNLLILIGRWLGIDVSFPNLRFWNPVPHVVFEQRLASLITRFRSQAFGPVLATPTHRGGWIDPRIFVDRLKVLRGCGGLRHRFDLINALLRLAPDFRAEALTSAADLPEPPGRIVRYALGGDERPTASDRDLADEWLAAARARDPRGLLEELQVLGFGDREPNVITPVAFRFDTRLAPEEVKKTQFNTAFLTQCIDWTPDAIVSGRVPARPTVEQVLLVPNGRDWHMHREWDDELLASQWPLNSEATLATACCQLMSRLNDKSSMFEPVAGILSPLKAVDRGWTEMARTALWLGLLGRDDQARGLAIDALIEGIADGRADPRALGQTLAHIASGGWLKIRRLIGSLRDAARTSILAERVVAGILDHFISSWQSYPRDANQVLNLQMELLKNLDQGLAPAARTVLFNLEAEGTTAKLARQLWRLEGNPNSPALRQSAIEAAEGRLARAERIARYAAAN
jgi:hypothetical protein